MTGIAFKFQGETVGTASGGKVALKVDGFLSFRASGRYAFGDGTSAKNGITFEDVVLDAKVSIEGSQDLTLLKTELIVVPVKVAITFPIGPVPFYVAVVPSMALGANLGVGRPSPSRSRSRTGATFRSSTRNR